MVWKAKGAWTLDSGATVTVLDYLFLGFILQLLVQFFALELSPI